MTRGATDLDWIPVDLPANIKLIVTVTDTDEGTRILEDLKGRISAAENILHLTPFSEDQWKEVITMGTIHLPDGWLDVREKTPIHAKVKRSLKLPQCRHSGGLRNKHTESLYSIADPVLEGVAGSA